LCVERDVRGLDRGGARDEYWKGAYPIPGPPQDRPIGREGGETSEG